VGALRWKRLAVLVGVLGWLPACAGAEAEVIYEDYSAYHHILVEDVKGQRRLRFDDALQSTMSLRDIYRGGFEYTDFFHVPLVLDPSTSRVLFVGLGGGTGPKAFLRDYPWMQVEVAEIDPQVEQVAREFFRLPADPRLRVTIQDGRVYLQRARRAYGAILMDAYASGPYGAYLPYHLVTQEFFALAKRRLTNGGCLVYNVMGTYGGAQDDQVRGVYSTLSKTFAVVYAFRARSSGNTVFVAQHIAPAKLDADGTRGGRAWPVGPWLQHPLDGAAWAGLARRLIAGGAIKLDRLDGRVTQFSRVYGTPVAGPFYTDNYAPVDLAPGRRRAAP